MTVHFFKEYSGYDSFLLRHWYLFWHLLGCLCSLPAFWPSVLFQGGASGVLPVFTNRARFYAGAYRGAEPAVPAPGMDPDRRSHSCMPQKRSSWTAYARLLPVSTGFDILYSGRNGFRSVSGFPVFYGSFGIGTSDSSTRRETSELLARISVRLYRDLLYGMVCFAFSRTCIPVIGRRKCSSGRFCSACVLPRMEAGLEP